MYVRSLTYVRQVGYNWHICHNPVTQRPHEPVKLLIAGTRPTAPDAPGQNGVREPDRAQERPLGAPRGAGLESEGWVRVSLIPSSRLMGRRSAGPGDQEEAP